MGNLAPSALNIFTYLFDPPESNQSLMAATACTPGPRGGGPAHHVWVLTPYSGSCVAPAPTPLPDTYLLCAQEGKGEEGIDVFKIE